MRSRLDLERLASPALCKAAAVIDDGTFFVTGDGDGTSRYGGTELDWPWPQAGGVPGEWLRSREGHVALLDLGGLLRVLGERIFVAEPRDESPAAPDDDGVVTVVEARLVTETAWDGKQAARFALDCAEHVLGDTASPRLRNGASLADVVSAARRALEGGRGDEGLLGSVSRVASARRLRRSADDLAHLAFSVTISDEAAEVDVLDDPDWESIAALRDAVLGAVEAVRHQAFPHLLGTSADRRAHADDAPDVMAVPMDTNWGRFIPGMHGGIVPAYLGAREAAERARQASSDSGGREALSAELSWQTAALARVL
ncbi:MAG: hypothetical protein ACRDZ6_10130 [Acidimicrobiales bacterium]